MAHTQVLYGESLQTFSNLEPSPNWTGVQVLLFILVVRSTFLIQKLSKLNHFFSPKGVQLERFHCVLYLKFDGCVFTQKLIHTVPEMSTEL